MAGFGVHTGKIAVYAADNVDTDRIIPARFLSMVTKSGYGELLFCDVRGEDFPLDQPEAQGATVLVVGTNFGCGSSREHAVWAIQQGGFVAVIARKGEETPGYSDIFRQNAANCGLLLIELESQPHTSIANKGSGAEITIDLPNQTISSGGVEFRFEILAATKDQIIKGLDLVGTTLQYEDAITEFERKHQAYVPSRTS
ncbi:MAG: 3-isopropylmalate dehydratase small subunit [Armatimonadetes bacterium]|nr:3-isopropylmalate dehydratase small subunit [Armatimonadota bacterium]